MKHVDKWQRGRFPI